MRRPTAAVLTPRTALPWAGLLLLLLLPPAALGLGEPHAVVLFTRIVILAIAAIGPDLILGYGGMVSFGHAAFVGMGGYTAGVLMHHAFDGSALIAWPIDTEGARCESCNPKAGPGRAAIPTACSPRAGSSSSPV